MEHEGNLLKMKSLMTDQVHYKLPLSDHLLDMNELIGKTITFRYLHAIHCVRCGRKTSKSFGQGYCYPCFRSAPETEECVLRPELCRAHEGIARDMDFARRHCLIDHFVYIAFTSGIKIGVTRSNQIPTRWIDQGAIRAVKLAQTPNRYIAGLIEVSLKLHFNDRTNWRKMLCNTDIPIDLADAREAVLRSLPVDFAGYILPAEAETILLYPGILPQGKLKSVSLDIQDTISDRLIGIKGQYLLFESGLVINIRKHNGYRVSISA